MALELSKDTEKRLIESIKRYFREQMDEDIGDLKASLLLEFCVREIGPSIYNHAIADAQLARKDLEHGRQGSGLVCQCWRRAKLKSPGQRERTRCDEA